MPELAPLLATTSGRKGSQSSLTRNVLLRPDVAFASGVLVLLLTVLAFYKEVVYLEVRNKKQNREEMIPTNKPFLSSRVVMT